MLKTGKHPFSRRAREVVIKKAFALIAFISVLILGLIVLFLFREGLPIFREVSLRQFLFGGAWYPTASPPEYGIWPLIVGSAIVTLCASLIAVPFGLLTAIYISEIAPARIKEVLKAVIELLAGLPSVVLGFFGMVILAPWMQETFDLPTGQIGRASCRERV